MPEALCTILVHIERSSIPSYSTVQYEYSTVQEPAQPICTGLPLFLILPSQSCAERRGRN